jgi:hypothetical protein
MLEKALMMQAKKRMYITMDTMADKAGGDACMHRRRVERE